MFDIRHLKFHDIISPDTVLEQVATDFDFTEGPIWHPSEQALIFSDILRNSIFRWTEQDGVEQLRRNSYLANGNAFDHAGNVITCEHATSRITRWHPANVDRFTNAGLEVLVSHFDDGSGSRQLNSPNDVVVKRDGAIYFTDPTSGRSAGYGIPREPELAMSGVYRLDPESKVLTLLVRDFAKPNGLCFSLEESQLFVNDTERQHIRVFDVHEDGTLNNGRIWAELKGDWPGVADGMKVDSVGNIYSCGPGGIHIFDVDGTSLGVILMPEHTTNFVFGDEDRCTLYITASTSLYRLRVNIAGHPTFAK